MAVFARFVHVLVLFMVSMAISTINLTLLAGKFETDNVMDLFRIMMKKKFTFVSNCCFRGVASFGID